MPVGTGLPGLAARACFASRPFGGYPYREVRTVSEEFQHKLSALVSKELCGDADAIGAMIERLTDALGLTIAVACRGDIAQADEMLGGVDGYLIECVANHAKLAAFMADCRNAAKRP